jgi:hypothetical protein
MAELAALQDSIAALAADPLHPAGTSPRLSLSLILFVSLQQLSMPRPFFLSGAPTPLEGPQIPSFKPESITLAIFVEVLLMLI